MKNTECEFRENCDLTFASSAKLPTFAKIAVYPDSLNKIVEVLDVLHEYGVPYFVIGGVSNILVKGHIFDGVFIKTDKIASKYAAENTITLGTGIRMATVIRDAALQGLGGMEGLSGIPGSVGGMVKQNAGAFGYEISDRFIQAVCYIPSERRIVELSKEDMQFSYRGSILSKRKAVLISATFEFLVRSKEEVFTEINEIREKRLKSQPINYPSLGSVFKRKNGVGAGFYIDRSGLKGFSVGGARVSEKHAGFIVNTGGATADDYLRVIDYVKDRVYATFGIELEEEIEII